MTPQLFSVSREWDGEIAFVVAGGPSVLTQDLGLLNGRKVIAVNCSHEILPTADFLIFADSRFWYHYKQRIAQFNGRVISLATSIADPKILRMHRYGKPGLARETNALMIKLTTLTAAINLAVHLGARGIVLLGADGQAAPDGRTHHHVDHPWKQLNGCWNKQKTELKPIAADLLKLGIPCINASPGSAWADIWPVMDLPEATKTLEGEFAARDASGDSAAAAA